MKTNEGIYFYCFHNKISHDVIVKSNEKINLKSFYIKFCIILIIVKIFEYSNKLIIKFMPLYIGFISAIIKYLLQRDAIYILDKYFCNIFYSFGYVIYVYDLLIYSYGKFYRVKSTFSFYPFLLSFLLYITLYYTIKNEYKLSFVMKDDFKKKKEAIKECCCICLKDFNNDNKKRNKSIFSFLFCKINYEDNIHKTNCNHYFHESCLFVWRRRNNICPICKTRLDEPKYYYFYEFNPCVYKL